MAVFGCLYTDMITRGALLPALTLVAIMVCVEYYWHGSWHTPEDGEVNVTNGSVLE